MVSIVKATMCQSNKENEIEEKLFRTAYVVATEHLPFVKYPTLVNLQKENGIDLGGGEYYSTNKACKRFIDSISEDYMDVEGLFD